MRLDFFLMLRKKIGAFIVLLILPFIWIKFYDLLALKFLGTDVMATITDHYKVQDKGWVSTKAKARFDSIYYVFYTKDGDRIVSSIKNSYKSARSVSSFDKNFNKYKVNDKVKIRYLEYKPSVNYLKGKSPFYNYLVIFSVLLCCAIASFWPEYGESVKYNYIFAYIIYFVFIILT